MHTICSGGQKGGPCCRGDLQEKGCFDQREKAPPAWHFPAFAAQALQLVPGGSNCLTKPLGTDWSSDCAELRQKMQKNAAFRGKHRPTHMMFSSFCCCHQASCQLCSVPEASITWLTPPRTHRSCQLAWVAVANIGKCRGWEGKERPRNAEAFPGKEKKKMAVEQAEKIL